METLSNFEFTIFDYPMKWIFKFSFFVATFLSSLPDWCLSKGQCLYLICQTLLVTATVEAEVLILLPKKEQYIIYEHMYISRWSTYEYEYVFICEIICSLIFGFGFLINKKRVDTTRLTTFYTICVCYSPVVCSVTATNTHSQNCR